MKNPRVFISHASDDNDRFVISFAKKLLEQGVDAWVDKWEMLPGDSLIDKIFEEGLKEANAVIIVLSKFSIGKPWVREEINSSFVKKVTGQCKLIPIVLDSVEVPECLKSTIWEEIADTNNYEDSLTRVVNSIFMYTDKPTVGKIPQYISENIVSVAGLNRIDVLVLFELCKVAMQNGRNAFLETTDVLPALEEKSVNEFTVYESIDILFRKGYIKGVQTIDKKVHQIYISIRGLNLYIEQYVPEFDEIYKKVCFSIVNEDIDNIKFSKENDISQVLVSHVYELLISKGWIKTSKTLNGRYVIFDVSPELRRSLELE